MKKLFKKPGKIISDFVKNENNAGFLIGAISILLFGMPLFRVAAMSGWGNLIPILTCLGIVILSGVIYRALPTGEELRGETPPRICTQILKWGLIVLVLVGIALLVFLRIGPPVILITALITLVFWVVSDTIKLFLKKIKK